MSEHAWFWDRLDMAAQTFASLPTWLRTETRKGDNCMDWQHEEIARLRALLLDLSTARAFAGIAIDFKASSRKALNNEMAARRQAAYEGMYPSPEVITE